MHLCALQMVWVVYGCAKYGHIIDTHDENLIELLTRFT